MAFTAVGLLVAGDARTQWWLWLLPAVLVLGPACRPGRVRRALQRSARRGRLRCLVGSILPESRPGTGPRFVPVAVAGPPSAGLQSAGPAGGHLGAFPLPVGRAATILASKYGGQPALLVWDERAAVAAVVLADLGVGYLEAAPARLVAGTAPPLSHDRAYPL